MTALVLANQNGNGELTTSCILAIADVQLEFNNRPSNQLKLEWCSILLTFECLCYDEPQALWWPWHKFSIYFVYHQGLSRNKLPIGKYFEETWLGSFFLDSQCNENDNVQLLCWSLRILRFMLLIDYEFAMVNYQFWNQFGGTRWRSFLLLIVDFIICNENRCSWSWRNFRILSSSAEEPASAYNRFQN